MVAKYTEIAMARALLAAVHQRFFETLGRIDEICAESSKLHLSADAQRARVRKETEEWVKNNPRDAQAVLKIFCVPQSE